MKQAWHSISSYAFFYRIRQAFFYVFLIKWEYLEEKNLVVANWQLCQDEKRAGEPRRVCVCV